MRVSLLITLLFCSSQLSADEPLPMDSDIPRKAENAADRGKARLELPVKSLLINPGALPPGLPAAEPPASQPLDPRLLAPTPKLIIESPTKRIINRTIPEAGNAFSQPTALPLLQLPRLDVGKGFVERPVAGLLFLPNGQGTRTPNGGIAVSSELENHVPLEAEVEDDRKKQIERPLEIVIADVPKADIEGPVTDVVAPKTTGPKADSTKRLVIERPVTEIVKDETSQNKASNEHVQLSEEVASDEKSVDDNPKVEPGKVDWHASFDEAKDAAKMSGKPVLLFHLMGQLDQRFT